MSLFDPVFIFVWISLVTILSKKLRPEKRAHGSQGMTHIWNLTCPLQHGKGECDGHGAVIKKKARLHLLVASNHINNAQELAEFISTHTKDSLGMLVTIQKQELDNASNASAIPKIKSNFEYVWLPDDPVGKYYYRRWPCYCRRCRNSSKKDCLHQAMVGKWYTLVQRHKGKRVIKVRSVVEDNSTIIMEDSD